MPGHVYALLAGINDYGGSLNALRGCVNDIRGFDEFLTARVPEGSLHVVSLIDAEATRQNIITGFTDHLSNADTGDIAIFYFSGHGSEEPVEQQYWHLEPTGYNQTIVCADSGRQGIPHLADKELNALIAEVAANGTHVLVVLDCCHSGSGTRDPDTLPAEVRARFVPPAEQPRPLEAYLPAVQRAMTTAAVSAARHVALSACEASQLSVELPIGAQQHGVFSAMLLRAMTTLGMNATYRELLGAASAAVRDRVSKQYPTGYAPEPSDLDQPLFGGAISLSRPRIMLEYIRGTWWIDAGTVHGIQHPHNGETTVLAVLPPQTTTSIPDSSPVGSVRIVDVEPTRSKVAFDRSWEPDTEQRYPVSLLDVPLPPASVELRGTPAIAALVRAGLAGSPHIRESTADPGTVGDRFVVLAQADQLTVARSDASPLAEPVPATSAGARTVCTRLEHLARWHVIKRLNNPVSTLSGAVTIEVTAARRGELAPHPGQQAPIAPSDDGRIHLHYRHTVTGWQPPYVFVYIHNNSDRKLYCALLDLTDRFRCHSRLFPTELIPAGRTAAAYEGRAIDVSIPQKRLDAGGTSVDDWLKLIASEQRFSAEAFDLPNLDSAFPYRRGAHGRGHRTVLDRLADRAVTRDAGDGHVEAPEWTTALVALHTSHP